MPRKIPTILGIFLTIVLVGALAFTTSLVSRVTSLFSKADVSLAPSLVGTGNVTDSGFAVYWMTQTPTTGAVFFGTSASLGDGVGRDDRDGTGLTGNYLTHFVRLTNLLPTKKYYFKIGSGTGTFGDVSKNEAPFEIATGAKLASTPVADPIFGKVLDSTGAPAADVLTLWESPGAGTIATLSKTDGTFILPIAFARSTDLNQFLDASSVSSETITLEANADDKSTITCNPGLDKPLPTVKLGQNIDCSKPTGASPTQSSTGFKPATNSIATSSGQLKVNLSDGEMLPSSAPTFFGKAGANQIVKIEVHSDTPYSGTVKAGPDGSWSWTPPANLSPGQHTVTITVQNADGTTQTVTRTFNVAAGEQILPITSGTPSASPTHLACVNNGCTVVIGAGPDSCTTNSDCAVPPATPAAVPAAPPVTGSTTQTLVLLVVGLLALCAGTFLASSELLS